MIVMLPGFGRETSRLGAWAARLPGSFGVLPVSPHADMSVQAIAARHARNVPADALIVGESLGGLIALAMAGLGFRAVALDPPLVVSDGLRKGVRAMLSELPADNWGRQLAAAAFGVMPDGSTEERNYYGLLDHLMAPVDIVIGATGCLLGDQSLIRHPLIRLHEISGSHALLDDNPEGCREIVLAAQSLTKTAMTSPPPPASPAMLLAKPPPPGQF